MQSDTGFVLTVLYIECNAALTICWSSIKREGLLWKLVPPPLVCANRVPLEPPLPTSLEPPPLPQPQQTPTPIQRATLMLLLLSNQTQVKFEHN